MTGLERAKEVQQNVDPDLANSLKERLDNDHLKFEDFQRMIQSDQQRIETLHEQLKNIDTNVTKITIVEDTVSSKFVNYVLIMRNLLWKLFKF